MSAAPDASRPEKSFHYFVDGVKYAVTENSLTGAQIKAKISNFNPAYQLVLEGRGNEPDKVIADTQTVNVDVDPPLQFYTVPPANFGG